jgi:hypothetical protein
VGLVEPDHRRLAVDTDTPAVWVRFITAFSRMLPNISAGLRAPADATTLGLSVAAIEPITFQFRSSTLFRGVFDLEVGRGAALAAGSPRQSSTGCSRRWPCVAPTADSSPSEPRTWSWRRSRRSYPFAREDRGEEPGIWDSPE